MNSWWFQFSIVTVWKKSEKYVIDIPRDLVGRFEWCHLISDTVFNWQLNKFLKILSNLWSAQCLLRTCSRDGSHGDNHVWVNFSLADRLALIQWRHLSIGASQISGRSIVCSTKWSGLNQKETIAFNTGLLLGNPPASIDSLGGFSVFTKSQWGESISMSSPWREVPIDQSHSDGWPSHHDIAFMLGIILGMGSVNERRRYIVTASLIGWAHTQNDAYMSSLIWVFPFREKLEANLKADLKKCLRLPRHSFYSKLSPNVRHRCFFYTT